MSCPPDCSEHESDVVVLPDRALPPDRERGHCRAPAVLAAATLLLFGGQSALADIQFWPARLDFPAGDTPADVAIGDLDGDQVPDLAVAGAYSGSVAVLLGIGDGTFAEASFYEAGEQPLSVTIGDLNGDQVPDLALSYRRFCAPGGVAVLLGLGDGSFLEARFYGAGYAPISATIGDLNGDRAADLVVASEWDDSGPGSVAVLLGAGDGTFAEASFYEAGYAPISATIGDLNGDHVPDLAVASDWDYPAPGSVAVLFGIGDGTFAEALLYGAGLRPRSVAMGDLNGDRVSDLAVTDPGQFPDPGSVAVLLGVGDGTFVQASFYSAGDGPNSLSIGDLNGDGVSDLAVACASGVAVLLGVGDGTLLEADSYSVGNVTHSVAIGDLNGDMALDLAAVSRSATVLIGRGDGTFAQASFYGAGSEPRSAAIADLNGDQMLDLAIANAGDPGSAGNVAVLLGVGDGTFAEASFYGAGEQPLSLAIGDLNGDRVPDLALATDSGAAVLIGHGDGTFGQPAFFDPPCRAIAIGDMNGDQILDLVLGCSGTSCRGVAVLLGTGDGGFLGPVFSEAGTGDRLPTSIAVGHLNGDYVPDVVICRCYWDCDVVVLLGAGDGSFGPPSFIPSCGYDPVAVAIEDLSGDEVADLAIAALESGVAVLLGLGDGTFTQAAYYDTGVSNSITIGDLDSDGLPDLVTSNPAEYDDSAVLLGIGDGTFMRARLYGAGHEPSSVVIGDLNGDRAPDLAIANQSSSNVAVLLGTGGGPVPVELVRLEVAASHGSATLVWETSVTPDLLGFHVYRADAGSSRFKRVNDELIRSTGAGGQCYEFIDRSAVPGETYFYRLEAIDTSGGTETVGLRSVTVGRALPSAVVLHQNSPNPFNPATSIAFELPEATHVTLRIYDIGGRLVNTLVDGHREAGNHSVAWNGQNQEGWPLASGIYVYRLEVGDRMLSKTLVLAK